MKTAPPNLSAAAVRWASTHPFACFFANAMAGALDPRSSEPLPAVLRWGGVVLAWTLLGVICAVQMYAFQPLDAGWTLGQLLVYTVPTWAP